MRGPLHQVDCRSVGQVLHGDNSGDGPQADVPDEVRSITPILHHANFPLRQSILVPSRRHASSTTQRVFSNACFAALSSTPVSSHTMRTARLRSFTLDGFTSTIRLLMTLPIRTIASVVNMFRISFVAVPDLRRVEPVRISGPTFGAIMRSGRLRRGITKCGLKQSRMVFAPRFLASPNAPQTKGVRPLAAIPTTTSLRLTPRN